MDRPLADEARERFEHLFGPTPGPARVRMIRAPGRVNLIGEHVDYNDGVVLPMAVEPHVLVLARGRGDSTVRVASTAFENQVVEFDAAGRIEPGEPKWANYARGMVAALVGAGVPVCGADLLIANSLPVGGGLSSSAAIVVGLGLALLAIGGEQVETDRLALLARQVEREFVGVPCGIMDQTIVAGARPGHAMLLDCRDLNKHFVPIDSRDLRVVIANTMTHHDLSDGEYARRVESCQKGVEFFRSQDPSVRSLRDVSAETVDSAEGKLDAVTHRRCRHVVREIDRTSRAAALLGKRRYEEVGELLLESHASLARDYEVSIPELDFLVDESMKVRGVYGARMTGAGFGGCIVALVQPRSTQQLIDHLRESFKAKFRIDPSVFSTVAAGGAAVVQ